MRLADILFKVALLIHFIMTFWAFMGEMVLLFADKTGQVHHFVVLVNLLLIFNRVVNPQIL